MIASNELRSPDNSMNTSNRRTSLGRTFSPTSVACFPQEMSCNNPKVVDFDYNHQELASEAPKHVRFDRRVHVRFTRSHRNYTPREFQGSWYQEHELQDIQVKCRKDLRKSSIRKSNKARSSRQERIELEAMALFDDGCEDDENLCLRGLETHEKVARRRKFQIRAEAMESVLKAQDAGCDDIEIARHCSSVTAHAQTWAYVLGIRDERDADAIYEESESLEQAMAKPMQG